jgi:ABC-type nitrate/sulfonate/bicarbonate transport system ATPase subunit
MSAALTFVNVSKSFSSPAGERRNVLDNFSLELNDGELIAVVGPSGIGKTTLLHLAAGLEQPDSGFIRHSLPASRGRVGMVFQQPRLLEWRSVKGNLRLAMDAAGVPSDSGLELLRAVQMAEHAEAFPLSLSGGERQRIALARAFAIRPGLLLMDEPFSALDELTSRKLQLLVQNLWLEHRPSGLIITHNTLEAALLADRVIVLKGRPCTIDAEIDIPLARPRMPDDVGIFQYHSQITRCLLNADLRPSHNDT